jgi:hypothetical protein
MYVYHKLNGRDAEAQTYLDTYRGEQHQIKEELVEDLKECGACNKRKLKEEEERGEPLPHGIVDILDVLGLRIYCRM